MSVLALVCALWVVLLQALGGTTALVHSHGGAEGHVHFVASEVRESDHGEWHRRAHGADEHEHEDGAELIDGALEFLLEFPDAPQVARDGGRAAPDLDAPAQQPAWLGSAVLASRLEGEREEVRARARGPSRPRAGPPQPLPLRI